MRVESYTNGSNSRSFLGTKHVDKIGRRPLVRLPMRMHNRVRPQCVLVATVLTMWPRGRS